MEKNLRVNNKFNVGRVGMIFLHPTSGYSEIHIYFEIHSEIAEIQCEWD